MSLVQSTKYMGVQQMEGLRISSVMLPAVPPRLPFVYLKPPCNALTNQHGNEAKYAIKNRNYRKDVRLNKYSVHFKI